MLSCTESYKKLQELPVLVVYVRGLLCKLASCHAKCTVLLCSEGGCVLKPFDGNQTGR